MPKRELPSIENDRIILRLLARTDLPLTLSWRNQADIRKWFLNSDVIPADKHAAWFEKYQELDDDFIFIILAKELGNLPVGQISLYNIDWDAKTAEFGRLMIGEPLAKGKGFAKEATQLLLNYGFGALGISEITLEVKIENKPAITIYRRMGFAEISRQNGLINMSRKKRSDPS